MELKENLTNEKIAKKFTSQFELVNYAIRLAENMIITGREPRVKTDSQNRSLQVLSEIINDKDMFDQIAEEADIPETIIKAVDFNADDDDDDEETEKTPKAEKKKARKVSAK